MSLGALNRSQLNKLLDFLRENRENYSHDLSWFSGNVLNLAVRRVYGRYNRQLSEKLRGIVRYQRPELLEQLNTQGASIDKESLVANKIAKIAHIIRRNHRQIDFRNFNRAEATKIARKFYDAVNVNKKRIDYINTFIRSHYHEIEDGIKLSSSAHSPRTSSRRCFQPSPGQSARRSRRRSTTRSPGHSATSSRRRSTTRSPGHSATSSPSRSATRSPGHSATSPPPPSALSIAVPSCSTRCPILPTDRDISYEVEKFVQGPNSNVTLTTTQEQFVTRTVPVRKRRRTIEITVEESNKFTTKKNFRKPPKER